jgi:hypothetical protein
MQANIHPDMKKLMVTFHNFSNAPKKLKNHVHNVLTNN